MAGELTAEATPRIAERGVIVQGLRLATAMSDAPQALLARAPLVVLPAAGHAWGDYRPILEHFARERRVFAFDWPGFGASAKPSPAEFAYTAASFADILAGWVDAIGIARAVLVGNSVGAAAAVHYAAANPTRVAALALVSPAGFTPKGVTRTLASRLFGTPALLRRLDPAWTSLYLGPTTGETSAIVARHRELRKSQSAEHTATLAAYAALWRSFDRPSDDLISIARQVAAPASVIRGALDPIITEADARRAAAALGEHGALQVTLPNAGHLPFIQQPDRFNQVIAGLLNTAEANAATLN